MLSCYGGMDSARCWEGREETGSDLHFMSAGSTQKSDMLPSTLDVAQ